MLNTERDGRVLRLTLNRPERRNALNLELCRALVAAFDNANSDTAIGAILLLGSGTVFCSGMDLAEAPNASQAELFEAHERLFTTIERIRKPILAAVHGPAIAGGTGLVANAHIVFAGPAATFGLPEIRVGLWPFLVYRAVSLAIGERRTMEWSLTGRSIQPEEAHQAGLVTNQSDDPVKDAEEAARNIAGKNAIAIEEGLRYAAESRGQSWAEAGRLASRGRDLVMASPGFAEGVKAFKEKRRPD